MQARKCRLQLSVTLSLQPYLFVVQYHYLKQQLGMEEPASKRLKVEGSHDEEKVEGDVNAAGHATVFIGNSAVAAAASIVTLASSDMLAEAAAGVKPGSSDHANKDALQQSQQPPGGNSTAVVAATDPQQQHMRQSQHEPGPGTGEQQLQHTAADPGADAEQQEQPPSLADQPAPVSSVPVGGAYSQREEHLMRQEASGEIQFVYVVNDGQPINMIRLMGLKVIFSKQLPNMPKEYICRLLLDRRHRSCALVAKNGQVLGGITYRVFPQQGFGEIAFCAVAASQQVRGFGTRLMNHTKAMARDRDNLHYFLTYADNNAVGYFTKQGFTREITLPRERWVGYIKDYDGGTLMEGIIQPKVPYTDLVNLFRVQREYLDCQIKQLSNSHVVHPGIPRQRTPMPAPGHARVKELPVPLNPSDIPGVKEAGWTPSEKPVYKLLLRDHTVVEPSSEHLHSYMSELLSAITALDEAWPFRAPVDPAEALDYYDIILDPVDLSLIAGRLASRQYYISLEMFVADVRKMCDNCKYYNAQSTPYYQCAVKLQTFMDNYLDSTIVEAAEQKQAA